MAITPYQSLVYKGTLMYLVYILNLFNTEEYSARIFFYLYRYVKGWLQCGCLAKYSLVLGYPPISVLCQWLKQIMALIDPLLFLLSFSEEIFIKKEFWNLEYLVFLKQKLFRCEFKTKFATPWEFLEKGMILVLERLKLLKVHDEVTFCFYRRLK